MASWLSQRRVKKKVHTSTQNISSFLELSGEVDTIYPIVLLVLLWSLSSLRCVVHRNASQTRRKDLSWKHILNVSQPLENRTAHETESDPFPKSVTECRDLFMLRIWAWRKGNEWHFFTRCVMLFLLTKKIKNSKRYLDIEN